MSSLELPAYPHNLQLGSPTRTRRVTGEPRLLIRSPEHGKDVHSPFSSLHAYSFQNYTDYFKCVAAKGEDYQPCKLFKRAYNSLCPSESFKMSTVVNMLPLTA